MSVLATASPGVSELDRTDAAGAESFAGAQRDRLLYDHRRRRWLEFIGPCWQADETGEALRRLQAHQQEQAMTAITSEVPQSERAAIVRHAVKQLSARQLSHVLDLAAVQPGLHIRGDELDRDPWLLAVRNGVIDLRRGEYRRGLPADLLSLRANAVYTPDASCERWRIFLDEVFRGNAALIDFVQRMAGYIATGITREQVFFVLHGTGANGKSVFAATLANLLGDYALTLPFSTFTAAAQHGSSATPDVAALPGRRCVTASETRVSAKLDEARIKALTGEDRVAARHLYGPLFEFKSDAKLLFLVNERPRVVDNSHGLWRRALLVPFERRFAAHEQDRELTAKLRDEHAGILNWLIEGCRAWQASGLQPPDIVRNAVDEWRAESDILAEFLANACEPSSGLWLHARELYAAFLDWCDRERVGRRERPGRKAFTSRLRDVLESSRRADGIGFIGMRPKREVSK